MSPEEMLLSQESEQIEQSPGSGMFANEQSGGFEEAMTPGSMLGEGKSDEGFMSGKVKAIPAERLMMQIQKHVEQDPEGAQEIIQNIAASGLSRQDIEDLSVLAVVILGRPELYESISETIKARFPETREVLTGDLEEDDDILINWVLAAYLNEGGLI